MKTQSLKLFWFFLLVSLSPCLLVSFLGCSKSTGPSTATVTGKVTLEAQTNHSGVTVALYELAELDTTVLRLNREYPNIGVTISQQTEFDHRLGTIVAQTQSRSDGSFRIDGVPSGEYNLVAQKDGFGWKYIYNL